MRAPPGFRLYLITDRRLVPDLPEAVERALSAIPPGSAAVQLREKDLSARELFHLGKQLRHVTSRHKTPLFVNDRIDVALAIGADGVHLTSRSVSVEDARRLLGEEKLVGASCHSLEEIGARQGADFATFSPVFPSPGKGPALSIDALREASAYLPRAAELRSRRPAPGFPEGGPLPLFALGGIDEENAPLARKAGAHGIAAIRSWLVGDPAEAVSRLWAVSSRP